MSRIDGAYRLVVVMDGCEHTHRHLFADKNKAWDFLRTVERGLAAGRDLHLVHWDTLPL